MWNHFSKYPMRGARTVKDGLQCAEKLYTTGNTKKEGNAKRQRKFKYLFIIKLINDRATILRQEQGLETCTGLEEEAAIQLDKERGSKRFPAWCDAQIFTHQQKLNFVKEKGDGVTMDQVETTYAEEFRQYLKRKEDELKQKRKRKYAERVETD